MKSVTSPDDDNQVVPECEAGHDLSYNTGNRWPLPAVHPPGHNVSNRKGRDAIPASVITVTPFWITHCCGYCWGAYPDLWRNVKTRLDLASKQQMWNLNLAILANCRLPGQPGSRNYFSTKDNVEWNRITQSKKSLATVLLVVFISLSSTAV